MPLSPSVLILFLNLFVFSKFMFNIKKLSKYSFILVLLVLLTSVIDFASSFIIMDKVIVAQIIGGFWIASVFGILAGILNFQESNGEKSDRIKRKLLVKLPILGFLVGMSIAKFLGHMWVYSIRDILSILFLSIALKFIFKASKKELLLIPAIFVLSLVFNNTLGENLIVFTSMQVVTYLAFYYFIYALERNRVNC